MSFETENEENLEVVENTETGKSIEVEMNSALDGDEIQTVGDTDDGSKESGKNIIEGTISKIKEKINIPEEGMSKTDFDVDLTEEEKQDALELAKEGELRRAEKKAKATQRNTETSIFFGTKILAGIGYVVNVVGQMVLTIVLFALPLVLSGAVAEWLQSVINREFGLQILVKYSDYLTSKRRNHMGKKAEMKLRGKDNFFGDVAGMTVWVFRASIVLLFVALVIIPVIHTIAMKIIIIFMLICTILFICKLDDSLVAKARDNESASDGKREEANMKMQDIMRESEARVTNMTVDDMTEKEKQNYLKSTNKVIKKD